MHAHLSSQRYSILRKVDAFVFFFCGRGPFPPHGRRSSDTAVKRGERRKVSRHFRRERKISENAHSIICAGGDQEILVVTGGEVSADKVL